MRVSHKLNSFLLAALLAGLTACNPSSVVNPVDPTNTGELSVAFDNRVGGSALTLGTTTYKNAGGEAFTVSTFNYFVSNIVLTRADGSLVAVPNRYFLIRAADAVSQTIRLTGLPPADYKAIGFTIGVDSLKSASPVTERTGALDPASYGDDSMYWSWNSGYIFVKFSGVSSAAPARADGSRLVELHVGGFGGGINGAAKTANNLRTVRLPFPAPATVRAGIAPVAHLTVDVAKLIDNSTKLSFATVNNVHSPAVAGPIADNYRDMFSVDQVRNEPR
jgi:hypothetical protein